MKEQQVQLSTTVPAQEPKKTLKPKPPVVPTERGKVQQEAPPVTPTPQQTPRREKILPRPVRESVSVQEPPVVPDEERGHTHPQRPGHSDYYQEIYGNDAIVPQPLSMVRTYTSPVVTKQQAVATIPNRTKAMLVQRPPQQKIQPRPSRTVLQDPTTDPLPRMQKSQGRNWHWLVYVGVPLIFVCLGISLNMFLPPIMQNVHDFISYGYPRTSTTYANVGHGTTQYPKSEFKAYNDQGSIEVLEKQHGDQKPQLYPVTTYEGPGADLLPVTVTFQMNTTTHRLDMVVHVNNMHFMLYNTGTSFTAKPQSHVRELHAPSRVA